MNGRVTLGLFGGAWRRMLVKPFLLGVGVLALTIGPAVAKGQFPSPGNSYSKSLTWPPISVNVSFQNGWVVAEGRTSDMAQRLVWRTPIAQGGQGLAVEHGWGSVFVQVGNRQFVVDDATGNTQELKPGDVIRQYQVLPNPPIGAYTPPAPSPAYVKPDANANANANTNATIPPGIEQLAAANQQLMIAFAKLDDTMRLQKAGKATMADVRKVQAMVDEHRTMVQQAQSIALKQISPDMPAPTPATKPAPAAPPSVPPPTVKTSPEIAKLQAKVLQLMAEYAWATHAVDELRALPPDRVDKDQLAAAQQKAQYLSDQLATLDMQLRQMRLSSTSPAVGDIDPQLHAKIVNAERRLMEAVRGHEAAERRVMAMHNDFEKKIVSTDEVVESQVELLSALRNINKAQNELDQLKTEANKAIEARNATSAPSGSTTAPADDSAMAPTEITQIR